ncbi:achaete-scute homolog 5 [Anguilla rostrata]|uniref:achaete-scute homolog 5 n=1 Tax=Anguilla rostrata TaxID=7938 RepID=UPI0030CFD0EE
MNAGFSHGFVERRAGLLGGSSLQYGMVPPGGHPEHRHHSSHLHPGGDPLTHPMPFLLYPASVDTGLYEGSYRGGPPLFPYLPAFHGHFGVYECPFEPAFIQKRNERERQRVKCVNQGYAKLRDHLPGGAGDKRLSKVETLRAAIRYIKYLQGLVGESACSSPKAAPLSLEDSGNSDGGSPRSTSESSSPGLYCGESEGSGS